MLPLQKLQLLFLESPSDEQIGNNVVILHYESTFQANDDENWMWGVRGEHVIKPKSRGGGIMVSDFVDAHNRYLRLTNEGFSAAAESHRPRRKQPREFLEYGKEHEGYWTAGKFLAQLAIAATTADIKCPRDKGFRVFFVFDHSSCHGTYAEELDASKMNLKPGGKQPRMHDTYWQGRLQRMVFPDGTPKNILSERGVDVRRCPGYETRGHAKDDFCPSRLP